MSWRWSLLTAALAVISCSSSGGGGADAGRDAVADILPETVADSATDVADVADVATERDLPGTPVESAVIEIPLSGPLSESNAELSGLAWHDDLLIILPQYPDRYFESSSPGAIFALERAAIEAFLDGSDAPLEPSRINFDDTALDGVLQVEFFGGYEAIAFSGDDVYLTIEAFNAGSHLGYLATATISSSGDEVVVNATPLAELPSQSAISNLSDEAVVVTETGLFTLHEANGAAVNPTPVARCFDSSLNAQDPIPLHAIEYRVTDATRLDSQGRFWVINYFFSGDAKLATDVDPLADAFGVGPTHAQHSHVERLVELKYSPSAIELTGRPPVQLMLAEDERNWEGLVRLSDRGFLLVTDKHPRTILGFVPTPE